MQPLLTIWNELVDEIDEMLPLRAAMLRGLYLSAIHFCQVILIFDLLDLDGTSPRLLLRRGRCFRRDFASSGKRSKPP
jgi:hypothetical protein